MSDAKAMNKHEYEALAEFRYALRQFLHFSEAAAQEIGLSSQQHQALLAIRGFPSREVVTIGELAERLQIRHHSAVELVDRMESQALVLRMHNAADKRQVLVQITEQGQALLERLSLAHRLELTRLRPHMTHLLEKIVFES